MQFVDGANDAARFDFPYDICVSGSGVLFVTDWGNHAIRQITPVGPDWVVSTIAGNSGNMGSSDGVGRKAKFNFPNGIALDADGALYVSNPAEAARLAKSRAGAARDMGSAEDEWLALSGELEAAMAE